MPLTWGRHGLQDALWDRGKLVKEALGKVLLGKVQVLVTMWMIDMYHLLKHCHMTTVFPNSRIMCPAMLQLLRNGLKF